MIFSHVLYRLSYLGPSYIFEVQIDHSSEFYAQQKSVTRARIRQQRFGSPNSPKIPRSRSI